VGPRLCPWPDTTALYRESDAYQEWMRCELAPWSGPPDIFVSAVVDAAQVTRNRLAATGDLVRQGCPERLADGVTPR
jgi:hypothetical protein